MTEEQIRRVSYTKSEVDQMIADAVAQAHEAVSYTHLTLPTTPYV